ncbi:cache domain-containing protein [Rhodoferax mekongensis]|uniref:Cache domain-containing protein n=1 Tax=Rhodoferax mekongensis TaxID=3068341 RepID=A0ABZ0AZA0_9BURK|nr:cache domain-containing protein [Rhodoferax sp. TBRC 17307]WNO04670.1 cache domain-containing protein [Rhodoferax sp. TBRC 17307]
MPNTAPAPEAPALNAQGLTRKHHLSLVLVLGGLALVLLLGSWSLYSRQKAALTWALSAQGEQLQLALNDTLDAARLHAMGMRQSAERNLRQPLFNDSSLAERLERRNLAPLRDAPWDRMPQDLAKDMGAVHTNPAASGDYRRELNAPLGALGQAVAAHAQQQRLAWSYFFDAQKRWRWVYPAQARDEVLIATGKADMGAALPVLWDAAGLDAAGPARNPQKEPVWSAPHTDPFKKITVVSALAPVYVGEAFVGAMGTDLSLEALGTVMQQRPLAMGQAWVIDKEGRVLASSDTKAGTPPSGPYTTEAGWLRYALRGSPFSLVIYAPDGVVASHTLGKLMPMLVTGLLGLLAAAGTALWLSRQFTLPALQLADYVQNAEGPNIKRPPKVPALWKPWFDRAARAALDRRDQVMHHHQRSSQLEKQIIQLEAQVRARDNKGQQPHSE